MSLPFQRDHARDTLQPAQSHGLAGALAGFTLGTAYELFETLVHDVHDAESFPEATSEIVLWTILGCLLFVALGKLWRHYAA